MNDENELAQRYCVMVGALMEDASAEAVTAVSDTAALKQKIERLQEAVESCRELLRVAQTLARIRRP